MKTKIAILTGLVLWTTACGEDAVGPDADELTENEAVELASGFAAFGGELIGETIDLSSGYGAAAVSAALVPPADPASDSISWSTPTTVTRSCPLGGRVEFSASLEGEFDDAGNVSATFTAAHENQDCAYAVEGDTVVTNGSGEIEASVERVEHEWSGEQTRGYQGEFDWSVGEDRSGHCSIDLTVTLDPGEGELTRTVSGTACGYSVEQTTTVGAS